MPGKHKEPTIAFRPSAWERAIIEQRVSLSGMYKKDFIARSCIFSNIVVVGKRDNVQRIVDAIQEMQSVVNDLARQLQSGGFSLSDGSCLRLLMILYRHGSYEELKRDYLAFVITVVDIVNGAAYLFGKEPPGNRRNWKAELEMEQLRHAIEHSESKNRIIERNNDS